ncbi:hypothetical protein GGI07_005199 [Coemansia sp. Benny D115]|nr:hypothetical protein GGI07_005199 [Coemansia sp. Benny D115]
MKPQLTLVVLALVASLGLVASLRIGRPYIVVQEASGIFSVPRITGDEGKNRTLNNIIRDVSQEDDLLDIKYIDLDPEQPKRSSPIHVTALAYVKDHIDSATAQVRVKYGFITLLDRKYDLCEELKTNLNKTCPVDEGLIEVNVDVDVPGFIPWVSFLMCL